MRLLPPAVVDRLPIDWWHPGNLHVRLGQTVHFCAREQVRSIEWNGDRDRRAAVPVRAMGRRAVTGRTVG